MKKIIWIRVMGLLLIFSFCVSLIMFSCAPISIPLAKNGDATKIVKLDTRVINVWYNRLYDMPLTVPADVDDFGRWHVETPDVAFWGIMAVHFSKEKKCGNRCYWMYMSISAPDVFALIETNKNGVPRLWLYDRDRTPVVATTKEAVAKYLTLVDKGNYPFKERFDRGKLLARP